MLSVGPGEQLWSLPSMIANHEDEVLNLALAASSLKLSEQTASVLLVGKLAMYPTSSLHLTYLHKFIENTRRF